MTLAGLIAAVLFACGLACAARALLGPSLHDRVVAAHAFAAASALAAAALGAAEAEPAYVDLAFAILLADALAVIVAFKFLRRRSMQTPLAILSAGQREARAP
jgi:multicomponent Na+:H+ antiporter subunit F